MMETEQIHVEVCDGCEIEPDSVHCDFPTYAMQGHPRALGNGDKVQYDDADDQWYRENDDGTLGQAFNGTVVVQVTVPAEYVDDGDFDPSTIREMYAGQDVWESFENNCQHKPDWA